MFKKTTKVIISQSFTDQQIITEYKFYFFGYKRCKRQLCFVTTFPRRMKYRLEILGNESKLTETGFLCLEYS